MKLRNQSASTPAPAAPPSTPAADEQPDATPAEVVAELRAELAEMRDHTGNHHTERLVDIVDRLAESLQVCMAPPANDDGDDDDDSSDGAE